MRNDTAAARGLVEGGVVDKVHVWEGFPEGKLTVDPMDVDVRDHQGWTPLMVAASHGHLEMCRYLIEARAILHKRKNFAATPLHLACRGRKCRQILRLGIMNFFSLGFCFRRSLRRRNTFS
jgi:hypothetical protein